MVRLLFFLLLTTSLPAVVLQKLSFTGPGVEPSFVEPLSVEGVEVPDLALFYQQIQPYLGQPISLESLEQIKRTALQFYYERDLPIVSIALPAEQEISSGAVHFLILLGKVGKVEAQGARWFSNPRIAKELRTKKGELVNWRQLRSDLGWINSTPFRKTTLIFQPGKELGETDIQLLTEDRLPMKVWGSYENTGNQVAGSSRFSSGLTLGNLFKVGHQLQLFFSRAFTFKRWWQIGASYQAPLPWRHQIGLNSTYSETHPEADLKRFHGKGGTLSWTYQIPFYREQIHQKLLLGYEFKRTNNFFEYAKKVLFNRFFDIAQFLLGWEGELSPSWGSLTCSAFLYISPGRMTLFNRNSSFVKEREGAERSYLYVRAHLEQRLFLPHNWSFRGHLLWQQASGRLLPSEELALGGAGSVRSYDENAVIGDSGFLARSELLPPSFQVTTKKRGVHQIQFLVFADMGYVHDADSAPFQGEGTLLASMGPGFRYSLGEHLSLRFDWGWHVEKAHLESRAHFNLLFSL